MKYYVLEITTVNGTTAKALWEHSTLEAAKAQYHQILASAYANTNLTYALVQIIDDRGFCQVTERIPEYVEAE
jgi:hypothetical protein